MEKITSTLRLRMSAKDAHYGGELVDGAHMVHLLVTLLPSCSSNWTETKVSSAHMIT